MDISTLQILRLVAEMGSFAAAARTRNVDPSAVSRSIAALEGELCVRLFHRTTRALALTEQGARYLERVSPLLDELEEAAMQARDSQSAPSGSVRIAASVAFGTVKLVRLLPRLRAELPDVSIELSLSDVPTNLVETGTDIALRLAPEPSGDVICARLARTRYHVCATPERAAGLRAPADLTREEVLRQNLPGFREAWQFRRAGETKTIPVGGPLLFSSPLALLEAACLGLGPALLADWLSDEAVRKGRLIRLFDDYEVTATSFDTGLWLLYPSRRYQPARVRAVIDILRSALGNA
ncbi:MAG: LysR family transcriptional regulator [Pseudomonadota bacterium]